MPPQAMPLPWVMGRERWLAEPWEGQLPQRGWGSRGAALAIGCRRLVRQRGWLGRWLEAGLFVGRIEAEG